MKRICHLELTLLEIKDYKKGFLAFRNCDWTTVRIYSCDVNVVQSRDFHFQSLNSGKIKQYIYLWVLSFKIITQCIELSKRQKIYKLIINLKGNLRKVQQKLNDKFWKPYNCSVEANNVYYS